MLHFRNTYKNCKIIWIYAILSCLFLMMSTIALLFTVIPQFRVASIVCCVVFIILFIISFFLLVMKNNDYKLKYFFRLGEFNKEFKNFRSISKGNKNTIKQIGRQQKDLFLQFGKCSFDVQLNIPAKNCWNDWIEDANAFNYGYSKDMEKLSYLTYILYDSCMSGDGLESFFIHLSYESFTNKELIDIITKSDFYSDEFKNFLINIIQEYDKEKQDDLFAKYELEDNKMFFSFEDEISDYANWIAYNRVLLSSCVGVYLHCNINFNMYRLFLSKDYQTVAYIYTMDDDDRLYRVCFERWDKIDCRWDSFGVWGTSIYDSVETAFNDIRYALKDYIEIEI